MRDHNNSFPGEKPNPDFLFLGHFRPWPFASPPGKRTRFNQNEGGKRIRDCRYLEPKAYRIWENSKRTESCCLLRKKNGHQNVTNLSFSHSSSLILYTPLSHTGVLSQDDFFHQSFFWPWNVPSESLTCNFHGKKIRTYILHINWFWLVNCETNKLLGPGNSWTFWDGENVTVF